MAPAWLQVGSRCLPRVLGALVRPCTVALYCHTKHRYDLLDMEFFQELDGCGLRCEEVGAAAARAAPPGAARPAAQLIHSARLSGDMQCTRLARCMGWALCRPAWQHHPLPSWRNTQLRLAPPPLSQVWEPDVPPPPASPPAQFPPADLFPDQRIAVYRITRRTGSQPGHCTAPH